ncbi:ABC transporter permease [Amycolatopsis sp. ATCC 39116]|uniref:ABC transporter permease n=1 Tax=Amycolatopsis sp. (strain ATCC 39116 / 75iv2) TaxID=385957 RepID=UPI0003028143|nr:ABC transporter permease [Amycolatopsis sp. ATCC 39116]
MRRGASIAAPLIVLTGLVLGQSTAMASFAEAGQRQAGRDTVADFVVDGPVPAGVPGVAAASAETEVPVVLTVGSGDLAYTQTRTALVVDPADYARIHPASGSLAALQGQTVAAGPGGDDVATGDTVGVRFGDLDLGRLPVVAEVPAGAAGGPVLLLPRGLLPDGLIAGVPTRTFVSVAPDADRAALAARLSAVPVTEWLARNAAAQDDTTSGVLLVVMGLGGLFAAIGVVNSVVIATGERRREFATARVTGLSRGQVVRAALLESTAVTAAGVVLGLLAAAGTLVAALAATAAVTGSATAAVPWVLVVSLPVGAVLITGVTSLLTAWSATRPAPVGLLRARD